MVKAGKMMCQASVNPNWMRDSRIASKSIGPGLAARDLPRLSLPVQRRKPALRRATDCRRPASAAGTKSRRAEFPASSITPRA
jgi:hypothetical protein